MPYTLNALPIAPEEPDGPWVAVVREFPGLEATGEDGPAAKSALMKRIAAHVAKISELTTPREEREWSARERFRNSVGPVDRENPKPSKARIEPPTNQRASGEARRLEWRGTPGQSGPVAPSPDAAAESNWRAGGWAAGGVLPK